jgi:hypothetical protein
LLPHLFAGIIATFSGRGPSRVLRSNQRSRGEVGTQTQRVNSLDLKPGDLR